MMHRQQKTQTEVQYQYHKQAPTNDNKETSRFVVPINKAVLDPDSWRYA
jgi:hypothetical protein